MPKFSWKKPQEFNIRKNLKNLLKNAKITDECPVFDVPPLSYADDSNLDSLWCKVAKVVLQEESKNTIKYIQADKTMYELFQTSGRMPFQIIRKMTNRLKTSDNEKTTSKSQKKSKNQSSSQKRKGVGIIVEDLKSQFQSSLDKGSCSNLSPSVKINESNGHDTFNWLNLKRGKRSKNPLYKHLHYKAPKSLSQRRKILENKVNLDGKSKTRNKLDMMNATDSHKKIKQAANANIQAKREMNQTMSRDKIMRNCKKAQTLLENPYKTSEKLASHLPQVAVVKEVRTGTPQNLGEKREQMYGTEDKYLFIVPKNQFLFGSEKHMTVHNSRSITPLMSTNPGSEYKNIKVYPNLASKKLKRSRKLLKTTSKPSFSPFKLKPKKLSKITLPKNLFIK